MRYIAGHNNTRGETPDIPDPNPSGICQCGCGGEAPVVRCSNRKLGRRKGNHSRFIHGHNFRDRESVPVSERGCHEEDANGCWIWTGRRSRAGYGSVGVNGRKTMPAHRAMWEELRGSIPQGHHLHHKCRVRACVNPAHLEPLDPAAHARERADLSMEKARVIRSRYAKGEAVVALARDFGVDQKTVRQLLNGKTWREAPESTWITRPLAEALSHARTLQVA